MMLRRALRVVGTRHVPRGKSRVGRGEYLVARRYFFGTSDTLIARASV